MLCWLALCLPPRLASPADAIAPQALSPLRALACWALQFTPRVVRCEAAHAVLMEVHASERLFGGAHALRERIAREAHALGCVAVAGAPTSLAALALARAHMPQAKGPLPPEPPRLIDGMAPPLSRQLNRLPLHVLDAVAAQQAVLARLGCRTLGDVRKLPRGGLNRRFVAALLNTLDQAYGERPETHAWDTLPEVFEARLELPGRVDSAMAMMAGAQRLTTQMAGWLAARHAGVRCFTLSWLHDAMRPRQVQAHGALTIHTAQTTRHTAHLLRLLGEHLSHVTLEAPVGDLILRADEVEPLAETSATLLLDDQQPGEPLHELLERLSARLGPGQVRQPVLVSDHRLGCMQHWQAANEPTHRLEVTEPPAASSDVPVGASGIAAPAWPSEVSPQPSWVLPRPLPLQVHQHKPTYHGPLQLMAGPQRIEAGWWHAHEALSNARETSEVSDRSSSAQASPQHDVARDYYMALSPHAGWLWVYRERMPAADELAPGGAHSAIPGSGEQWFLHGLFA